MAATEYYVRGTNGTDSAGNGTSHATAYQTLQYAMDDVGTTHGRNTTDGDRFNICDESSQVLSATLSFASYGATSIAYPIRFEGYTTTSGDGGIGNIDCNGSTYGFNSDVNRNMGLRNLKVHNFGTATYCIRLSGGSSVLNCEVTNGNGTGIYNGGPYGSVIGCHVHDIGNYGIHWATDGIVYGNYVKNDGTRTMSSGIYTQGRPSYVLNNIVSVDSSTNGINLGHDGTSAIGNTVLSNAGTGSGIFSVNNHPGGIIIANIVEGFSGTGGKGIDYGTGTEPPVNIGSNSVFNCTTKYANNTSPILFNIGDDEEQTETVLEKSGSDTFANRFIYFAPKDVGNVQSGGYPTGSNRSKGAVQNAPSGGGGIIRVNLNGGM